MVFDQRKIRVASSSRQTVEFVTWSGGDQGDGETGAPRTAAGYHPGVSEAAFEFSLDEVGEHIADLRQAAHDGGVVYLTDGGRRLAAVVPIDAATGVTSRRRRLSTVIGTLPGFEHDVDVETSRDGWDR